MNTAVDQDLAVPFVDLVAQHAPLREELLEAVGRVLDHGQFILGPEVEELESRWAAICGVRHAISVSDGTAALGLALRALDIGAGDEVITAPNTFVATASSVALSGATPRFADVGDDFNIDPQAIRHCINSRTKAIIAVHLTGRPAAMDEINHIATEHGLLVIEDAAQAMGAKYRGRPVGGLGRLGCFSLHPLKTAAACGDAGMITTNDEELALHLRRLRNHGFDRRQEDCQTWGYNARTDTLQAALALVKLKYVDEWTTRRRAHAALYRRRLSDVVGIPHDRPEDLAVYHTFPIQASRRDQLVDYLRAGGIGCAVHYRVPIHLLDVARGLGYRRGDLPMAERQAEHIVALPVHQNLNQDQINHVCGAIEAFYT